MDHVEGVISLRFDFKVAESSLNIESARIHNPDGLKKNDLRRMKSWSEGGKAASCFNIVLPLESHLLRDFREQVGANAVSNLIEARVSDAYNKHP